MQIGFKSICILKVFESESLSDMIYEGCLGPAGFEPCYVVGSYHDVNVGLGD